MGPRSLAQRLSPARHLGIRELRTLGLDSEVGFPLRGKAHGPGLKKARPRLLSADTSPDSHWALYSLYSVVL